MDYKEKYEQAIERLKQWDREHPNGYVISDRDKFIFPELTESKDERIKKSLIRLVKAFYDVNFPTPEGFTKEQLLSWLEKQGEQKPQEKSALEAAKEEKIDNANKAEPKFKAGDWVVCGQYGAPCQIESIKNGRYYFTSGIGIPVENVNIDYHLWTIQDAKDGDVLASNRSIFIFSQEYMAGKPEAYCGLMNGLFIEGNDACWTNEKCYPATKEQRDLLFQKMKEAGYEWDAEKKELKKIEQKPVLDVEIPFGAKDSELEEVSYNIPNGYHAEIEDNKVIIKKGEQKSSWSKEDEREVDVLKAYICSREWSDSHIDRALGIVDELVKKLKSLRPQSIWKPSDEQMEYLAKTITTLGDEGDCKTALILNDLRFDLKKLTE